MPLHAVPRLPPGLTARDRLRARLDADVPLVVLHAPAGYGKTVALAQWATSTPRRGLWVRVREGIGEPQSFAQHLADELDDAGLLDDDNPLRTAAESLGAADPWALLIRGLRRLEPGFTLVIDESELLYDETVDGIIGLVADLPGLSVRTATRRANHFTRRTLAVDIGLDLIDTSALALTAQEAARILDEDETGEAVGHVIDNGAAPAFARVVLLAGRQLASRPTTPVADADRALEMAVESLLWPRLRTWDADFVEFLQVVALSEVIDVALATELTGAANAGELLDRAEIEGLGYWTAPTVRTAALFVFSPAFRRIVERAVRRRMARSRLRELDLRIARWHLAADRPFPALRGAVMCQDWDLATDVLREYWFALLRSGAQCRDLFRAISPLALRSFPLISMFLAIIYNAGGAQRLRALEFFALAAYGARNQRATGRPADRALLAVIESAASRLAGRTDASARAAQSGVEVLRGMSNDERDRLGRNEATAYNQLGLSLYYAGRTREAMECFRRSVAVGEERGLLAGLQGLAQLAGTLAVDGDMRSAAEAVADADARRWPDSWREGYAGSLFQLARTLIALEADDPDGAAASLATLDPHRATIEHWVMLEQADALIRLMRGDAESAVLRLDRAESEHRSRRLSPTMLEDLRALRVLVSLAAGDLLPAEQALAKMTPGPRRAIARARLDIARGDAAAAVKSLAAAPVETTSARLRAEHLSLTVAALAMSAETPTDREDVVRTMRRLRALLEEQSLRVPVLLVPVAGLEALQRIADTSEDVPAALRELIERAREHAIIGWHRPGPRLSQRELAVARELALSDTVAEIAAALSVSPNTVKSQLRAIYRKLDVSTRDEALRALSAEGITGEATRTR